MTAARAAGRPRVLLLLPTTSYRAHDLLAAADRLGLQVVVGTDRRQVLAERSPATNLTLDFGAPEAAVEAIVRFAERHPLRAVVGADDETTVVAAAAAQALGLPANPVEAVAAAGNKFAVRERLRRAGLASPRYRLLDLGEDPRPAARQIGYPVVIKPTFLSASRGVMRADGPDQLLAARRRLARLLADPEVRRRGGDEAGKLLLESYVPGREYAVEAILSGGALRPLAIFDKPDPLEGPYFEETIYVTPSRAPRATQRAVLRAVQRAAAAIGLLEGPVHAEARANDEGVYVLEVAARAIGGLCPRVLRFGTGMSLEELMLRHALGEDPSSWRREPAAAGVMMIPIPRAGILREVRGLQAAREVPGVEEITISIPRGQRVVPLPEGDRYLGFIFARRRRPRQAEATLREAHRRLELDIVPESREALSPGSARPGSRGEAIPAGCRPSRSS